MIVKLTTTGKNEILYVNFNYVRTMRSINNFTELTLSDDKYHKITVIEKPEEIYGMLYQLDANVNCCCHNIENDPKVEAEAIRPPVAPATTEVKKPTAKKTAAKAQETN